MHHGDRDDRERPDVENIKNEDDLREAVQGGDEGKE
jgi:hypothetical protein